MNTSDLKTLDFCRICGGEFFAQSLNLEDSPLANELALSKVDALKAERFPLQVVMCSECKHFQLKHLVSQNRLFSNYVYKSGTSSFFRKHFSDLAQIIATNKSVNKLSVVEIGSNDGVLLYELRKLGISCLGVEPSNQLARECSDQGLDVIHGFLSEDLVNRILSDRGPVSVVVGNNVFAHIDDLLGAFRNVNALLDTDGLFIFEVADFAQISKKGIFDSIYHEHMSFHTVTGLRTLAQLSHFRIEDFTYLDSHGGSFRFFLRKMPGNQESKIVSERIEMETDMGLNSPLILEKISQDIAKRRIDVHQFLRERDKKSILVGYGAPAKAVTFISEMYLEEVEILAILDDNDAKQGKFLPGSAIPILSRESLLNRLSELGVYGTPIDFLIFPWNLGPELVTKLKSWSPRHSRIITFFPDIEVVSL